MKVIGINDIKKKNYIFFGRNNDGKTYLLKSIFEKKLMKNQKKCFENKINEIDKIFFIPAIRLMFEKSISFQNRDEDDFAPKLKLKLSAQFFDELIKMCNKNELIELIYLFRKIVLSSEENRIFISKAIKDIFDLTYTQEMLSEKKLLNFKNEFSDGILNVINIISTIIYVKNLYSSIGNKSKVTILIDEVELYMHISSQVKLLEFLEKEFSNVIFILTTHSTILLQRTNNYLLYKVVKNNKKIIMEEVSSNLYFKNLELINDALLGLKQYPDEVYKLLKLYKIPKEKLRETDMIEIQKTANSINTNYPNLNLNLDNPILLYCVEKLNDSCS